MYGCYAYGESHLGEGGPNLRSVNDFQGEDLVKKILALADEHQPFQVSLVGGEPLIRHRELSRVIPELCRRGIQTLAVTSAVIPIPEEWTDLPGVTVAVSVDGSPEDHDIRRKPATYERILRNIKNRTVNIHWTVVRKNLEEPGYMDRYLEIWNARPEVRRIWVSIYTPQLEEDSAERLTPENRRQLATYFKSVGGALLQAGHEQKLNGCVPRAACRVEPCVFGGEPNCAECGCSISMGLHRLGELKIAGPLYGRHLINASIAIGRTVNRAFNQREGLRWGDDVPAQHSNLVQIE